MATIAVLAERLIPLSQVALNVIFNLPEPQEGTAATGHPMARARSLTQFQNAFPDEAICAAFLFEWRWPDGFICAVCCKRRAAAETLDVVYPGTTG